MKEGKAKTTAKKKTTKKPSNTKNTNKVKEVEKVQEEEKFLEEDDDKRLIVFIAIAILIIVGTIIGLLVGCQKEKEKEPEKQEGEDIVIPVEPDKKDDKEKEYNREKPLPVVRKVTKKTKKTSSNGTNTDNKEETYTVVFYLDDESTTQEVKKGDEAPHYVPDGYSECSYYTTSDMTEEYTFGAVSGEVNVYMSCSLIEYSIVYNPESNNPNSYTVKDQETTLVAPEGGQGVFAGWFTSENEGEQVTTLNKNIISYADGNNTIYLYGRFTQSDVVVPTTGDGQSVPEDPNDEIDGSEDPQMLGRSLTNTEELPLEEEQFVEGEEPKEEPDVEEPLVGETPTEEPTVVNDEPEVEEPKVNEVMEPTVEEPKPVVVEEEKQVVQDEVKEEVKETPREEKPVTTEPTEEVVEKRVKEEVKKEVVIEKEEKKEKPVVHKEEKKEEVKEEPEATPVNEE